EEAIRTAQEEFGDLGPDIEQFVELDAPNLEYWVSSLDMMCALCEKAQPTFTELAFGKSMNETKLIEMLYCATVERYFNVRKNAFALVGDLIVHCSDKIGPHIGKFMPLCIENLKPEYGLVCNNASWCVGVALEKYGSKMNIYWKPVLEHLIVILKADDKKIKHFVKPNAAITLARLACTFPNDVIKLWDKFAVDWMNALSIFNEDDDKIMAFQTLIRVINANPKVVVEHRRGLRALFFAICSWKKPPPNLQSGFNKVLFCFLFALINTLFETQKNNLHICNKMISL
ncbi:hypothetical protein RFI_15134, partial [Reticulomyxa filosa]